LVHRAVALRHLVERQGQVEDLAGVDLPVPHQVNQLGQEAAHRRGATMEIDLGKEQPLAVELDSVRDADVAHGPARPDGTDRLHHGLWVPTHSSTASAPMSLVSSLIRATLSSPRSVTMSVTPNSRASF